MCLYLYLCVCLCLCLCLCLFECVSVFVCAWVCVIHAQYIQRNDQIMDTWSFEWGRNVWIPRWVKEMIFNRLCLHRVPIAMSPIQGDTAGAERTTVYVRLLMSGMSTGDFICTLTSWRACRRASSTAWPACGKCRPAPACGVGRESEWELHRHTCIYHQRGRLCVA